MATVPSVYFILGTPGSGRRDLVRDLVENGLAAENRVVVLVATDEAADAAEEKLAARPRTEVRRCAWDKDGLPAEKLPADATVFLLAAAAADPITQLEALKPWLEQRGAELARIITVVDCQFAQKHPPLLQWYDALLHFSDVALLTRRAGVENKWLSDFLKHFQERYLPTLFIQCKKGDLPNPALVLDPVARRLSQYFDEAEDLSDIVIETDDDEEPEEGEDDGLPPPEAYFERLRNGHRAKPLPNLRDYLG
jgi:hypothetical protein